jgi:hypothetical protein
MSINETCKKLGSKRLDIIKKITSNDEYQKLWPKPKHSFDFEWGECWKAVIEYGVYDFNAEVGFYIDYLGFGLNASWDNHAMLMTPNGDFSFTVYKDVKSRGKTKKLLNMQFMLGNIKKVSSRLKRNGVKIIQPLAKEWGEESKMKTFKFETPNGISVTLWGFDK